MERQAGKRSQFCFLGTAKSLAQSIRHTYSLPNLLLPSVFLQDSPTGVAGWVGIRQVQHEIEEGLHLIVKKERRSGEQVEQGEQGVRETQRRHFLL
jgi:hypothetical protein